MRSQKQNGRHGLLCKMRHWRCKAKFRKAYSECVSNASIVFSSWIVPHMSYSIKMIQIFCHHSHKNGVLRAVYYWQVLVHFIFFQSETTSFKYYDEKKVDRTFKAPMNQCEMKFRDFKKRILHWKQGQQR